MMSKSTSSHKTSSCAERLLEDIVGSHYNMLHAASELTDAKRGGFFCAADLEQISFLIKAGVEPKRIFFLGKKTQENIHKSMGNCLMVANSISELKLIDTEASVYGGLERLEEIVLHLGPEHVFLRNSEERNNTINEIASCVKGLPAISVRGCLVESCADNLYGKQLARVFSTSYQLAKRLSAILPCSMKYLGICNILSALRKDVLAHPQDSAILSRAAEVVGMQNATAFYAQLLIN